MFIFSYVCHCFPRCLALVVLRYAFLASIGDVNNLVIPKLPLVLFTIFWFFSNFLMYNLLRRKFSVTSFTGSPNMSDVGFDLLNKLLTYEPNNVFIIFSCS